jgi:hypothetical protein
MTSDCASQNQSVNIMCALISVHGLQISQMPNNVVLVDDTIASEHVSCIASNGQSLATVVPFHNRDHLGGKLTSILELGDAMDALQAKSNFSQHVCHLELDKLHLGKGLTELLALECVFTRCMEAVLGCAHGTPCNSESSLVKAGERTLKSFNIKHVLFRHLYVVHHDHSSC